MTWEQRIHIDPLICHGQACINGTRVPVSVVLDNLAAGLAPQQIIDNYPSLTADDVHAAIRYAAELAREQVIDLPKRARYAPPQMTDP
jgi:uncharacterized protein (DUF433 family)